MSREMRHSGIEWIGEIPKEWKTISFSNGILRMSTGLNPRDNFELSKDDEYYYVTIKNFKDGKIYLDDNCDRISKRAWEIIQERSQLKRGDILFASISKDGQAYILKDSPVNWNINESVFSIRTNHDYFYDKYFYYHIIDSEYYNDLRLDATGTTFQSIKQNKLRKSILCLPPLSEQLKIANYLDKVCGEVDEMIALQEQMIEELKAYKQSVITEAVTKGLNPDVPMKNSGIDWIGEIPEHWNLIHFYKTNWIRARLGWKGLKADEYTETGYPFLSAFNIINDKLVWEDLNFINQERYDESPEIKLSIGDLLLVKDGAGIGKCAVVDELSFGEATVNSSLAVVSPNREIVDSHFQYYYFKSAIFQNTIWLLKIGMGVPHLTQENMRDIIIPNPPLSEQQSIASYLDTQCAEIDALIAIKQAKIDELKDYKKSVIYEYVTGKKEVV